MTLSFLIAALLTGSDQALNANELTMIRVETTIESKEFVRHAGDENLALGISRSFAAEAETRVPFVDWGYGRGENSARLVVRLRDIEKFDGADNVLQYTFEIGDRAVDLRTIHPPLYDWHDRRKPWRRSDQLAKDIRRRIVEDFSDPRFGDQLEEVTRRVPLTRSRPVVDGETQRVVLPLPWARLALDRDAVLRLNFTSTRTEGRISRGTADVSFLDEHVGKSNAGAIEGSFQRFVCPPKVMLVSGPIVWSDEIVILLDARYLQDCAVYMQKYSRGSFESTQNGLLTKRRSN